MPPKDVKDFLELLVIQYKQSTDVKNKFNLLNLIVQIEAEYTYYSTVLYKHLKTWLTLYVRSIEIKKIDYDKIIFLKVKEKLDSLNIEQQYELLKYFIRYLKKELYEIEEYELLKKQLEIKILFNKNKIIPLILKSSSYNIWAVFTTLLLQALIFSIIWMILQNDIYQCICIDYNSYLSSRFWNYFYNVIGHVFAIGIKLEVNTYLEFIFLILIKLIFYIFITYFALKEISKKVEKYL